jgi:hypothetical protein
VEKDRTSARYVRGYAGALVLGGIALIVMAVGLFNGLGNDSQGLQTFYAFLSLVGAGVAFWTAHRVITVELPRVQEEDPSE